MNTAEPEELDVEDDRLDGADICPACLAELTDGCSFCPACAAPVSPTAAMAPFERVLAEGYIYRQAISAPRRLIVIVGVWVIFLVFFITGVVMIASEWFAGESSLLYRLEGSFLLLIGVLGLYHATRNYLARPQLAPSDAP